MTEALFPPPKKNPQKRSIKPTRPPEVRSRASLGLTAAAAEGRFALQQCTHCSAWQYPPRDACVNCLSTDLEWNEIAAEGTLIAETTVQTSPRLYYRERMPWRMGTVQLDAGPVILAHLHEDVAEKSRVRMIARLDRAGQGVLVAMPVEDTPLMEDASLMRELTADPKHRRILITDARASNAPAIAKSLLDAGAATDSMSSATPRQSAVGVGAGLVWKLNRFVRTDVRIELARGLGATGGNRVYAGTSMLF